MSFDETAPLGSPGPVDGPSEEAPVPAESAAGGPGPAAPAERPAPPSWVTASPPTVAPPARRRWGWLDALLVVSLVVAVAGVTFAVGRVTAPQGQASTIFGGRNQGRQLPGASLPASPGGSPPAFPGQGYGQGEWFYGGRGSVTLQGTVESISDGVLTLKLATGTTIQVALGDETTFHRQEAAASGDVATGTAVLVQLSGGGVGAAQDVTILGK